MLSGVVDNGHYGPSANTNKTKSNTVGIRCECKQKWKKINVLSMKCEFK